MTTIDSAGRASLMTGSTNADIPADDEGGQTLSLQGGFEGNEAFERLSMSKPAAQRSSFDDRAAALHKQVGELEVALKTLQESRANYLAATFPPALEGDRKAKLVSLDTQIRGTSGQLKETQVALKKTLDQSALHQQLSAIVRGKAMTGVMQKVEAAEAPVREKMEKRKALFETIPGVSVIAGLGCAGAAVAGAAILSAPVWPFAVIAASFVGVGVTFAEWGERRNKWKTAGDGLQLLDKPALYVGNRGFRTLQEVVVGHKTERSSGAPFIPGRKYTYDVTEKLPRDASLEDVTALLHANGVTADQVKAKLDALAKG